MSPVFSWLDRLGKDRDEHLLDFSMRAAREQAWVVAHQVWGAAENEAEVINRIDRNVARLGERVGRPRTRVARWIWRGMALTEGNRVAENIDRLSSG